MSRVLSESAPLTPKKLSSHKILVVDDDESVLELMQTVLKHDGHFVQTAHTGKEGLRLLSSSFDLLLLDVVLPDISGFDLCEAIRSQEQYKHTLVILMSSQCHEFEAGYKAGADDYLIKNGHTEGIRWKINSLLRRHRLDSGVLTRDNISLDPKNRTLRIGQRIWGPTDSPLDKHRHLTPNEFRLLYLLVYADGQPVKIAQLLKEAFASPVGASGKIEVAISRLRDKLPRDLSDRIKAIRNVGYVFENSYRNVI